MLSCGFRHLPINGVFITFDAAKVRRFLQPHKLFDVIVCDNSPFVDAGQRIADIRKYSIKFGN
jgi:hypothetical protein